MQYTVVMSKEDEIFRARQALEGKKGGQETLKRHGVSFYKKIAKKRWASKNKNGK